MNRQTRIARVLLAEGNGSTQEQWFNYKSLGLNWHTEDQLEIPLSFDIIAGTPYLVTMRGDVCKKPDGSVNGIKVVSWKQKHQIEVPFALAPIDKLTYNLHRDYKGRNSDGDRHDHITLDTKRYGMPGVGGFVADHKQGTPLSQLEVLLGRPVQPCQ